MKLAYINEYIRLISKMTAGEMTTFFGNLFYYFWVVLAKERYCEKKVNNYKMILDLKDRGITRELMFYGTREKDHIICLKEELREGMTVLDIGANLGYYSVMLGKMVGKKGRVYAVEPSKLNFAMLVLNVALNELEDVVETFNIGISNKSGMANFYESTRSNWHTFYPKVHRGSNTESLVMMEPSVVSVMTIGDFQEGKRKIDLIRMDVEGFEVEILDSMTPLIDDLGFRPKILFEVHQPRYDSKEHDMRNRLKGLFSKGYYTKFLASSSYEDSTRSIFRKRGYSPDAIIKSDGRKRGIFHNIADNDAIELICDTDLVRSVLLETKIEVL